jgi:hypothetical protein
MNDLQKKLTQLRGQQENLQNQTNKMSGEINEYIFLIKQRGDYNKRMMNGEVDQVIRRN